MKNISERKETIRLLRLPFWLLGKSAVTDIHEGLAGDMEEEFDEILISSGKDKATAWIWFHAVTSLPKILGTYLTWSMSMMKNYYKIAFRNIKRNKVFSAVNILGLALGLACCILIILFVHQELSYDRFHEKADRLYRLTALMKMPIGDMLYAQTNPGFATVIKEVIPEVEDYARVTSLGKAVVRYENNKFSEWIYLADPQFFQLFSFQFIAGDPATALSDPRSIVLCESTAKKIFGELLPINHIVRLDGQWDFRITGIIKDVPQNSHLGFSMIVPLAHLRDRWGAEQYDQGHFLSSIYLLLKPKSDPAGLESKFPQLLLDHYNERIANLYTLRMQPITSIHLEPGYATEIAKTGLKKNIYFLTLIAALIFIVACMNFINMSIARSFQRVKEVGIRKVVGGNRFALIRQFVFEAVCMAGLALLLSILFSQLSLPFFNRIWNVKLTLASVTDLSVFGIMICLPLIVGILAGAYPAFVISGMDPVSALSKKTHPSGRRALLRTFLVVLQFAVSVVFIVYALVVVEQMGFINQKDLKFEPDNVAFFQVWRLGDKKETLLQELLQSPHIEHAALAEFSLGSKQNWPEVVVPEGKSQNEALNIPVLFAGPGFFNTLRVPLLAGRDFEFGRESDVKSAVILNESAAKLLGGEDLLGRKLNLTYNQSTVTIIGVVADFNVEPLSKRIQPYLFYYDPSNCRHIAVRINSQNVPEIVDYVKEKWLQFDPESIFDIQYASETIQEAYSQDRRMGRILGLSAALAILIASMGLFGLALYAAERRTKEIGIRKVVGASVWSILLLMSRDFIKWVLAANLLALPAAYFLTAHWLDGFAYRIRLSPWIFLVSMFVSLLVALLTVGYHTIKAAAANPVDSLRYE